MKSNYSNPTSTEETKAAGNLPPRRSSPGFVEFVALIAMLISLVALSIDAMLPALPEIGRELGVQRENSNQLIVTLFFLGLAAGQLIYGPLSDRTGRKPAIYAGLGIYILGCVLSLVAINFPMMLLGRTIQGAGAAAPRVVTMAIVRDRFEGRAMARVMSFAMTVFILVPVIAPALGQGLLVIFHWRAIFGTFLILAVITASWFALRLPETLATERRIPFSPARIMRGIREVVTNRIAFGYTVTTGLITGAFLGYLNSAQQIFQDQYQVGTLFPLFFAILSLSLGSASFLNARLVMRFGMRSLSSWALHTIAGFSAAFFMFAFALAGHPPMWMLMLYLSITFFGIGILFGNLNALAMEPLGHIAGVGAAVIGALVTLISLLLGMVIGQSFNGTVLPLVAGFLILSIASIFTMHWPEGKKRAWFTT